MTYTQRDDMADESEVIRMRRADRETIARLTDEVASRTQTIERLRTDRDREFARLQGQVGRRNETINNLRDERDQLVTAVNALHDQIASSNISGQVGRSWILNELEKITAGL